MSASIAKWLGYRSVNRKVASSIPSKATSVLLGYCQDISFFAKWFGVGAMFSLSLITAYLNKIKTY